LTVTPERIELSPSVS